MGVQAVFFDLDYTLYDQSEYIRGALKNVADVIAREAREDARALTRSLFRVWRILGTDHGGLFDVWLARHGLFTRDRVTTCVGVFHDYHPVSLRLYPGVGHALRRLRSTYHIGIVTDGHARMQRTKIGALSLEEYVDSIVYCAELLRSKPDLEVFHYALRAAGAAPKDAVFVGDHPIRDILGARRAGMRAVRVTSGEFRHLPDHPRAPACDRLRDVRGLPALLARGRHLEPEPPGVATRGVMADGVRRIEQGGDRAGGPLASTPPRDAPPSLAPPLMSGRVS